MSALLITLMHDNAHTLLHFHMSCRDSPVVLWAGILMRLKFPLSYSSSIIARRVTVGCVKVSCDFFFCEYNHLFTLRSKGDVCFQPCFCTLTQSVTLTHSSLAQLCFDPCCLRRFSAELLRTSGCGVSFRSKWQPIKFFPPVTNPVCFMVGINNCGLRVRLCWLWWDRIGFSRSLFLGSKSFISRQFVTKKWTRRKSAVNTSTVGHGENP